MTSSRLRARGGALVVILALAVLAAAGAGAWYLFFRSAGPPPVSLASLPPATPGVTRAPDASTAASPDGTTSPGGSVPASDGIAGTWAIDPSVGSFSDFSGSFAGYRVREELASVGATEAVGRTPGVTGSLVIEGTSVTSATITVDLTTLQSDERNRDRQLGRQALETSQFPTAAFALTQPITLDAMPADGAIVDVTLAGDLTLHGVTRSVQVPAQARLQGGVITVAGSLPITFADYGIQKPQAMVVLSVEDHGTLEFQVHFTRGQR